MKFFIFLALLCLPISSFAESNTTYFMCKVKESYVRAMSHRSKMVKVKFAIKDLVAYKGEGKLVPYPGTDEESGPILVKILKNRLAPMRASKMSNLNAQGGDLRVDRNSGNIRLFGDGAGYQFTDLVLWGSGDESLEYTEGYVRDYGPTYGDRKSFKRFINCEKSNSVL